jgi:hypothetical protein
MFELICNFLLKPSELHVLLKSLFQVIIFSFLFKESCGICPTAGIRYFASVCLKAIGSRRRREISISKHVKMSGSQCMSSQSQACLSCFGRGVGPVPQIMFGSGRVQIIAIQFCIEHFRLSRAIYLFIYLFW